MIKIRRFVPALVCAGIVMAPSARGAEDGFQILDRLKPGEWVEAPNSNLKPQIPNPKPPGDVRSIMGAWSGGAYDTKRERLIVWGGGHGDYAGNEIYAFDVKTLAWSRIWGPTPNDKIPPDGCPAGETYGDGNPRSRHTYDGLEYLPVQDKFWIHGGSVWSGSGGMGKDTWWFDPAALKWEKKAGHPQMQNESPTCDYDPGTGHVFFGRDPLFEYDPVADTWVVRGAGSVLGWGAAAIDVKRRKYVYLDKGSQGPNQCCVFDLEEKGKTRSRKLAVTGDTEIMNNNGPGLVYDPVVEKLVAWNGGVNVYTLDLEASAWTKHPPAAANTIDPGKANSGGTYGRFRYIPSHNVYLVVNGIESNMYFYKFRDKGVVPGKQGP